MNIRRNTLASALALAAALTLSGCTGGDASVSGAGSTSASQSIDKKAEKQRQKAEEKAAKDRQKAEKEQAKAAEKAAKEQAKADKKKAKSEKNNQGVALATLNQLKVSDNHLPNYNRDSFKHWSDLDGNGCNTRQDALIAFMKASGCPVSEGTMTDPYSSDVLTFTNDGKGGGIDIDHIVSLSNGWKTGMGDKSVSDDMREQFANDPLNLVPTDKALNTFKSDKDASQWLPSYGRAHSSFGYGPTDCVFVSHQIAVKKKYSLWVTPAERDAMSAVLATCPDQALPVGYMAVANVKAKPAPKPTVTAKPKPTATAKPKPVAKPTATAKPKPKPTVTAKPKPVAKPTPKPAPKKTTAPKSSSKTDPDMGTCVKAIAAGYGPYIKGVDPEYHFYFDKDKDGMVCDAAAKR